MSVKVCSGVVVALLVAACHPKPTPKKDGSTTVASATGSGSGSDWDAFDECVRPPPPPPDPTIKPYSCNSCVDPQGQGRILEGLGLDARADSKSAWVVFGTMDRFKLDSITLHGVPLPLTIEGFNFVLSPELEALAKKNRAAPDPSNPLAPDGLSMKDWLDLQITGSLRCTSDPKKTMKIVVQVIDARWITVDSDTTKQAGKGYSSKKTAKPAAQQSLTGWRFGFDLLTADGVKPKHPPTRHERTSDPTSVANSICEENADGALPMLGFWDLDGTFKRDDKTIFSFACTKREVAKCVDYGGYALTKPQKGLDFLQACGRMMTADYCGKGQSYTEDDTWIEFWDTTTTQAAMTSKQGPEPAGAKFEGAWSDGQLLCYDHERHHSDDWTPPPSCLTDGSKGIDKCASATEAVTKHGKDHPEMIFSESCDPPCKNPK
jgi:ADYC domain